MTTLVELKAQYRREVGDSLQAYEWAADVADLYPLTLRFPADAQVAVVAGRCRRLPDGTIEATFSARFCPITARPMTPKSAFTRGHLPSPTAVAPGERRRTPR